MNTKKSRGLDEDMKDQEVREKREERVLACEKNTSDSHSRLTVVKLADLWITTKVEAKVYQALQIISSSAAESLDLVCLMP